MNVFVTGGAGFIGSHIVDRLIDDGNSVTVYDNLSSGKREFIKHHLGNNKFTFIEADLIDNEKITEAYTVTEFPSSMSLSTIWLPKKIYWSHTIFLIQCEKMI